MSLDILIPTFNRSSYLIKNLESLSAIITTLPKEEISIIINDNASHDDTQSEVKTFIETHPDINIAYYRHPENIGLCRNVLDIVSKGSGEYLMILGDDDFTSFEYIKTSIEALKEDGGITCILPAFEAIDEKGNKIGWGRDIGLSTRIYPAGIESTKINSVRAHQISGIILKREGLKEAVNKAGITNLYPQIFLTAYSCLNGKCKHIPEYPIMVTQTSNKAWRYDDIGLLGEIFENFKALHLSGCQQFSLEHEIIRMQRWRAFRYYKHPIKQINVIRKITFHKNSSKIGNILLGPYLTYLWSKMMLGKVLAKIKK